MIICEICGKEVKSLSRHKWKAHGDGVNHKPFTGKTHNKETREILSQKVKQIHKDSPVPRKPPDWTGKQHSEISKKSISESMKGNRNANHRGDRQSYYKGIRMDSSWEVKVASYLDSKSITWVYNEKSFVLSDGRHYYPDFFVYQDGEFEKLIEVKGYFREQNRLKFELFQKEYPYVIVELWDKSVMKSLKLI